VFDHLELNKVQPPLDPRDIKAIEDYLIFKVDRMVKSVEEECKNKPPELSMPMIRLKIENSGYSVIKSK
jgi:hypothetical protein